MDEIYRRWIYGGAEIEGQQGNPRQTRASLYVVKRLLGGRTGDDV